MKRILCFGDSNTWGFAPKDGYRFDENTRWTGLVQKALPQYTIIEEGLNGRTALWDDPIEGYKNGRDYLIPCLASQSPLDLVILMLGTNDLLQGRSLEQATERLERFLSVISMDRSKILLIAPPPVTLGAWVPNPQLIEDSRTFAQLCQVLAERLGIRFADAGKWDIPLAYDGVHFTEQGHKAFAAGLLEELK